MLFVCLQFFSFPVFVLLPVIDHLSKPRSFRAPLRTNKKNERKCTSILIFEASKRTSVSCSTSRMKDNKCELIAKAQDDQVWQNVVVIFSLKFVDFVQLILKFKALLYLWALFAERPEKYFDNLCFISLNDHYLLYWMTLMSVLAGSLPGICLVQ